MGATRTRNGWLDSPTAWRELGSWCAPSDCKPLRDGVWELRMDHGPGYRVYYAQAGRTLVLLLIGGD